LNRVALVVNGRGRRGQVIDGINFDIKRESNVVPDELKMWVVNQMRDIALRPSEKVVNGNHFMAITQKPVRQV